MAIYLQTLEGIVAVMNVLEQVSEPAAEDGFKLSDVHILSNDEEEDLIGTIEFDKDGHTRFQSELAHSESLSRESELWTSVDAF